MSSTIKKINVTSNRDWSTDDYNHTAHLKITPDKGNASSEPTEVTIELFPNRLPVRVTNSIKFLAGGSNGKTVRLAYGKDACRTFPAAEEGVTFGRLLN